ncbi:HAMP domain-containing sensor histidine kinase [Pannus brasiliensis CCIBt3594]|uniref:histidine kinase n=1 Tax=Pannus brasiliensis CCIBt3594 TaxID=1427578 RepID=A0AAW9QU59_9CHRO
MFQATRRRLALWYTAVTAILLLLFATGMFLYVRHTLVDRVDDTLKHVIEVVNRSLVIQSLPPSQGRYQVDIAASFPGQSKSVEDDRIDLEWFDPRGNLLWSTLAESPDIPLHPNRIGETIRLSDGHFLRQVTERVEIDHHVLGYLRVSHPWFEVTKPIRQLLLDLSVGLGFTIACVAAIGWFLSGLAIEPVKESYQRLKQFTADASHELRNPIATIQTNVQMALAYPQTGHQRLEVIDRLTGRLGNLVNDLLFLARSDSGIVQTKFQPVPLDALLMEVIEEQRSSADEKGISLSLSIVDPETDSSTYSEEMFTLPGDWDQLARLFTNVISNAMNHAFIASSESRSIEVELQQTKRDRHGVLQVKVRDNGIGIPETDLPRLFDRFYRLDPARQNRAVTGGTGLGLAIARAITESHHGQIAVESALDRGTTFTVTLPKNPIRETRSGRSDVF